MLAHAQTSSYSEASVADLTASLLVEMQPKELISVIRAADLPGKRHSEFDRQPERYDRHMLLRLAHIARRCCRTQDIDPSRDGSLRPFDYFQQRSFS